MIRGQKVMLRTVREPDLDELFGLQSDIDNRGDYFPLQLRSETGFRREFHETGFWQEDHGRLLICDAGGRVAGLIAFGKSAPYYDGYELSYIIYDPGCRNQGYTTEAVSLLVRYLFLTRNINRLQIVSLPGNIASKRVAEKCGFQFEGVARGAFFHRGAHHDVEVYSILRREVTLS